MLKLSHTIPVTPPKKPMSSCTFKASPNTRASSGRKKQVPPYYPLDDSKMESESDQTNVETSDPNFLSLIHF